MHSRRCLPLISNVGHHGRSPCLRAYTAFAPLRTKFTRSSLLLRLSPPKTSRAFHGTVAFGCTQWHPLVATLRVLEPRRRFFPAFGLWRQWCLLLVFQSGSCWRFAPQRCAWQSVSWRSRVRLLISHPSRPQRRSSGKVEWHLRVCGQRALPARDAQPFNQPDSQRRVTVARFGYDCAAVVCRLSQTLGITVGRHAFGPPQPSLSIE
jgi:hypothetical protein